MKPIVGLVGLAGQYEIGFDAAPGLLQQCGDSVSAAGMGLHNTGVVMYSLETAREAAAAFAGVPFDALVVCVFTWSEDHHLLDLLDLLDHTDRPVILWAFPSVDSGSMCGVHQICSVLKELDHPYHHVYGDPDDCLVLQGIRTVASAAALCGRMRTVRVGTVGGRIKGMTEIAFDEFEIKKRTGVRIVNIGENELANAANRISSAEAEKAWERIGACGYKTSSCKESLLESMRYYLGMKALIDCYALEGIVVKCYPEYMGKICLGYSMLSEEGIVCGCEGDVNNTVTMKMLFELTGMPVHNTDILYPDIKENTLLFSHCGSGGFTLAASREEIHLAPVRLADAGVCTLFTARPGTVTLANLVGRGGTMRMSVMTGEAVPCAMEFPGNPIKVRFEKSVLEIDKEIADQGIGHHWMVGYGDVTEELRLFCEMKGIRFINV